MNLGEIALLLVWTLGSMAWFAATLRRAWNEPIRNLHEGGGYIIANVGSRPVNVAVDGQPERVLEPGMMFKERR